MERETIEEGLNGEIKMYEETLKATRKKLEEVKEEILFLKARQLINNHLVETKKSCMFGDGNLREIKMILSELFLEEDSLHNSCVQMESHLQALKSLNLDDLEYEKQ